MSEIVHEAIRSINQSIEEQECHAIQPIKMQQAAILLNM